MTTTINSTTPGQSLRITHASDGTSTIDVVLEHELVSCTVSSSELAAASASDRVLVVNIRDASHSGDSNPVVNALVEKLIRTDASEKSARKRHADLGKEFVDLQGRYHAALLEAKRLRKELDRLVERLDAANEDRDEASRMLAESGYTGQIVDQIRSLIDEKRPSLLKGTKRLATVMGLPAGTKMEKVLEHAELRISIGDWLSFALRSVGIEVLDKSEFPIRVKVGALTSHCHDALKLRNVLEGAVASVIGRRIDDHEGQTQVRRDRELRRIESLNAQLAITKRERDEWRAATRLAIGDWAINKGETLDDGKIVITAIGRDGVVCYRSRVVDKEGVERWPEGSVLRSNVEFIAPADSDSIRVLKITDPNDRLPEDVPRRPSLLLALPKAHAIPLWKALPDDVRSEHVCIVVTDMPGQMPDNTTNCTAAVVIGNDDDVPSVCAALPEGSLVLRYPPPVTTEPSGDAPGADRLTTIEERLSALETLVTADHEASHEAFTKPLQEKARRR